MTGCLVETGIGYDCSKLCTGKTCIEYGAPVVGINPSMTVLGCAAPGKNSGASGLKVDRPEKLCDLFCGALLDTAVLNEVDLELARL